MIVVSANRGAICCSVILIDAGAARRVRDLASHSSRVSRENAPPQSELGRLDLEYRTRWCEARNLAASSHLMVTPEGVRARSAA